MPHFLPLVVLICVAIGQMVLSHAKDLSPWKGGGFGMFSTIDYPSSRYIRAYTIDKSTRLRKLERSYYKKDEKRFRTLPTKKRFDQFVLNLKSKMVGSRRGEGVEFLVVEYWKYTYSSATGKATKKLVFPKKIRIQ